MLLYEQGSACPSQAAWYKKSEPAFGDLLNAVRVLIRKVSPQKLMAFPVDEGFLDF